jgi:hypothetical protein
MKKIVLVFICLVAVIGGLTYWFFENLDDFIKSYMVEYGSKMTKTDVEVDSVKTDISKGEIIINRVGIENPKGFSNNEAFEAEEIIITVNKGTWNNDIIEIPLVLIKNPEIIYEYNGKKTNFIILKENIESYIKLTSSKDVKTTIKNVTKSADNELAKTNQTRSKTVNKDVEEKRKKTFFIKELKIIDLEIKAKVSSIKKDFLNKKIPLIAIKNIGSETKGASPEFILESIILKIDDNLETIFDFKSLKTDIRNNVNKIIDKLKGVQKDNSGKEKIDHKKIINNLKDLF